jgi:hypothetical protein
MTATSEIDDGAELNRGLQANLSRINPGGKLKQEILYRLLK